MQENVGILELGDHLLGVGDEVGREIAAIELHALDDVELGLHALGLFDRDHALIADLLHGLGDHVADLAVVIGRDRADLRDLVAGRDLLAALLDVLDHRLDGHVDAALEIHRIEAGGNRLDPLLDDRLCQHGRSRGAVASESAGPGGDLLDHLGAHVLELVGELDLLGDGDAVLGDARRAERFVEDDVAALWAQRHLDGVGENIDAAEHALARVGAESYVLGGHVFDSFLSGFALGAGLALNDAHEVRFLHDHQVLAVELDLGPGPLAEQHPIADLDVERMDLAILGAGARPSRDDLSLHRLFLGRVGDDDAAGRLLLLLDSANENAVLQRAEFHGSSPWMGCRFGMVQGAMRVVDTLVGMPTAPPENS